MRDAARAGFGHFEKEFFGESWVGLNLPRVYSRNYGRHSTEYVLSVGLSPGLACGILIETNNAAWLAIASALRATRNDVGDGEPKAPGHLMAIEPAANLRAILVLPQFAKALRP